MLADRARRPRASRQRSAPALRARPRRLRRRDRAGRARARLQRRQTASRRWLPGYTERSRSTSRRARRPSASSRKQRVDGARRSRAAASSRRCPTTAPRPRSRGIGDWFNTKPLTLAAAARQGRARRLLDVLVHQLPAHAAAPEGLGRGLPPTGSSIVGVHTPEFAFEHVSSNVRERRRSGSASATRSCTTTTYGTWNAYGNQYWPAEYLIDRTGHVRHVHFGEGDYDETESVDPHAARRAGTTSPAARRARRTSTPTEPTTPESYLGYERLDRYAGSPSRPTGRRRTRFPATLAQNDARVRRPLARRGRADRRRPRRAAAAALPRANGLPRARRHGPRPGARADGKPSADGARRRRAGSTRCVDATRRRRTALLELRFTPGRRGPTRSRSARASGCSERPLATSGAAVRRARARAGSASARRRARRRTAARCSSSSSSARRSSSSTYAAVSSSERPPRSPARRRLAPPPRARRVDVDAEQRRRAARRAPARRAGSARARRSAARRPRGSTDGDARLAAASCSTPTMPVGPS